MRKIILVGLFFIAAQYASAQVSLCDSQVAQWRMNDNAANTTVEDSASTLTGTFIDATGDPNTDAHTTPGVSALTNTALTFDGVDDVVRTGQDFIGGSEGITLAAWIYTSKAVFSDEQGIFGGNSTSFLLRLTDDEPFVFMDLALGGFSSGVNSLRNAGIGLLSRNTWHHVAISWHPINGFKSYVDAVPSKTGATTIGSFTWPQIGLGASRVTAIADPLEGGIDDARVFNRELTQDEVTFLYNEGLGTEQCAESTQNFPAAIGFGGIQYHETQRKALDDAEYA